MEFITLFHHYRRKWLVDNIKYNSSAIEEWCKNIVTFIILPHHVLSAFFLPFLIKLPSSVCIWRPDLHYCITEGTHINPLYDTPIRSLPSVLINDFTIKHSRRLTSFLGETWSKPHFTRCETCLSETLPLRIYFLESKLPRMCLIGIR